MADSSSSTTIDTDLIPSEGKVIHIRQSFYILGLSVFFALYDSSGFYKKTGIYDFSLRIFQEFMVKTSKGSISVLVCGDQEKPALITYPDVALNCIHLPYYLPSSFEKKNSNPHLILWSHSNSLNETGLLLLQISLVFRVCSSAQMQLLCCFTTSAFITLMLQGMRSLSSF